VWVNRPIGPFAEPAAEVSSSRSQRHSRDVRTKLRGTIVLCATQSMKQENLRLTTAFQPRRLMIDWPPAGCKRRLGGSNCHSHRGVRLNVLGWAFVSMYTYSSPSISSATDRTTGIPLSSRADPRPRGNLAALTCTGASLAHVAASNAHRKTVQHEHIQCRRKRSRWLIAQIALRC